MADKYLLAGHAVVFPEIPGSSPLDYVQEIGSIVGSSHIHSFYKNDDLIKIYLTEQKYAEKVLKSGIRILGHHLPANNIKPPSLLKVTLSRVDPIIPNKFLEDLLETYGKIVSPLTHHKVLKDAAFAHIDSGVRHAELQVCNGVSIPSVIQVKYKDILCAVVVEVKEKVHSKRSWVRRSIRRRNDAKTDSTFAENDCIIIDDESSNQSSLSVAESVSLSDKIVRNLPHRSLKKIIDIDKLPSATHNVTQVSDRPSSSTCNLVEYIAEEVNEKSVSQAYKSNTQGSMIDLTSLYHGENSVVESGTNSDLVDNKQLLSHTALSICDFSVPKNTESGFSYLKGKQRLKSGKVLNELFSKDLIRINKVRSRSVSEQCAVDLNFPGCEQANVSRYAESASGKRSQKKSVISELLPFQKTPNQINKKVTSYTLNKICDIQLSKKTSVTTDRIVRTETNDRAEIEKAPSNSHARTSILNPSKKSIPKQEHIEASTFFQDTPKSSKTNLLLPKTSLTTNNNFAQCSSASISKIDQTLYRKRRSQSRLSSNVIFDSLNLASTSTQNSIEYTDASTASSQNTKSSKCLDFNSDSCKSTSKDFNKEVSLKNCEIQAKSSVLRSKKLEISSGQVNTNSMPQAIGYTYVPSSLKNKKKSLLLNLNESSKDDSIESQLKKLRSSSKKAESSIEQIPIPVLSQDNSCDDDSRLLLNKEESQCLNKHLSTSRLMESSPKSSTFSSNKSQTRMKQMPTSVLDISCKDASNVLMIKENSRCSNLDQSSSKERSARSRPKRLALMTKKSETSIEMLMPILEPEIVCNDATSSALDKKKSQCSQLKARSKSTSVESLVKNLQSHSKETKPTIILMPEEPALHKEIVCNDVPSSLLHEDKFDCHNIFASSSKDNSTENSQPSFKNTKESLEQKTTIALPQDIACNDAPSSHLEKKDLQFSSKEVSLNKQCQPKKRTKDSRTKNSKSGIKQNPLPTLSKDEITLKEVPSSYTDKGRLLNSNLKDDSIKSTPSNQLESSNSNSKDIVFHTLGSSHASVLSASSNLMSKDQIFSELDASSKDSEKRPSDTQCTTKNGNLCPRNKDFEITIAFDSTPVLTQNIICDNIVSSPSKKEQTVHPDSTPSLKTDSSIPFRDKKDKTNLDLSPVLACITCDDEVSDEKQSDTQGVKEGSSLTFRVEEDKIDVNLDVLPVLSCVSSNDTIPGKTPSDTQCSNEENILLCSDKDDQINLDLPPVLACVTSNDVISGKKQPNKQGSNEKSNLPDRVEGDKIEVSVDVLPVLSRITSNEEIPIPSSNKNKPQYLDVNSTSNSKDISTKQPSTQSTNLKKAVACDITCDSLLNSTSIAQNIQCHGVAAISASNKKLSKQSNVLAKTNTDKLVNLVQRLPISKLQVTKTDTKISSLPVFTQNPITPPLPNLIKNVINSDGLIQNFSTGECKSTDFDFGLSNSHCINLNSTAILPIQGKTQHIGMCLPISQFVPDSMNCKALSISKPLSYNQSTNSQKNVTSSKQDEKAIELNPTIALAHNIELVTPQIASILVHHDKVGNNSKSYQYILPKPLDFNDNPMNVGQSQTKVPSSKKRKYGIGSIFHKTKSSSGNQNKNKKPIRKRKSKAKTQKANMTSKMNSVQNKTCFSEYEFNSSDSDSNGISYSKWRSQNKTPQKRFRSSSVDEVNGLSSLAMNDEPYDLSFKSRKVTSTVVNNPRFDYNTLIRRKRERINAICQRVSLINKKNLSGGSFQICKNKEVVKNLTIHEPLAHNNASKEYPKEQQVVELKKACLNAHRNEFISNSPMTALAEYVSDLECNIGKYCSKNTRTSLEANREECQALESSACGNVKSNFNCNATVKSLQKKEFKKSLSQIHAKKVRKRMKKNRVRYMCLQNDGKKIVLKKVSTPDNHRNVVDLVSQSCKNAVLTKETSSSISNELNAKLVNRLKDAVDSNSVMHPDTENLDFNTCVNGFLQQLAHCNKQATDVTDFSIKSTSKFVPINLVTKTICEVDNNHQLKDFHSSASQNENLGLVLECQSSEAAVKDCVHNLQPNSSIQCAASSTDECNPTSSSHKSPLSNVQCSASGFEQSKLTHLVVQKNVQNLTGELNGLDGKCLNDNVVSSTNFEDHPIGARVVVKVEEPEVEDCISSDASCVQDAWINSHGSVGFEQHDLDSHLTDFETADSSCVDDSNQPSLAIKIEAVYGAEKVNSMCISELIEEVQTEAESSRCGNDTLNENLISDLMGVPEKIRKEISSDDSIPLKDCILETSNVELLNETSSSKLQFISERLDKSKTNTTLLSDEGVPDLEQNEACIDQDLNQAVHVSNPAERVMRKDSIKSEVEEDSTVSSDGFSNEADGKLCSISYVKGHPNSSSFNEIVSTEERRIEVKKEKFLLNKATNVMDVPSLSITNVASNSKSKEVVSQKTTKNSKMHDDSCTFESTPPKKFSNCNPSEIFQTGKETERLDLNNTERNRQLTQSLGDPEEELPNTQGHYMIEKTEKPNTFRIYRQISVSSDHTPSKTSLSPEANELVATSNSSLKREFIQEDEKWGPYLVKQKGQGLAKRFKRSITKAQSPKKKFLPKKKNVLNSSLSDGSGNSNQNICDGKMDSVNHIVSVVSSNDEENTLASSTSVSEADSSNLLIPNSFEDCDSAENGRLCESNAFMTNCSPESNELDSQNSVSKSLQVVLSSDTSTQPCDKSVVDSVKVVPTDIYSVYRTISKKECSSSTNSVINFPLSEQCLVKFLHAAKGHANPKKLALNVLQNNKTPGALKELIVQLYDYFKVCNDKKKKLRVSRLIMLLDNRNNLA